MPSTAFGSLGIDEVTKIGHGLDDKVEALLQFLGVEVSIRPALWRPRLSDAGPVVARDRLRRAVTGAMQRTIVTQLFTRRPR